MSSNSAQANGEADALPGFIKMTSPPSPPLIDVDCNLLHKDLMPLLDLEGNGNSTIHDGKYNNNNNNNNDNDNDNNKDNGSVWASLFPILQQDAIRESNIIAMLSPSSTLEEAQRGLSILARYQEQQQQQQQQQDEHQQKQSRPWVVRTTVGIHPYNVPDLPPPPQQQQQQQQQHRRHQHEQVEFTQSEMAMERVMHQCRDLLLEHTDLAAAVGECGLDRTDGFPPLSVQLPWFAAQIQLAQHLQRPLFVHERGAFVEMMNMLQSCTVPILIHCFTGTANQCREYVDRGYSISLSGYILKVSSSEPNVAEILHCLEEGIIPLNKLMVETDAPYMGFVGCRDAFVAKHHAYIESALNAKKRKRIVNSIYPNVPSSLRAVLEKALHHINIGRSRRGEKPLSEATLAWHTCWNANSFFAMGLDEQLKEWKQQLGR